MTLSHSQSCISHFKLHVKKIDRLFFYMKFDICLEFNGINPGITTHNIYFVSYYNNIFNIFILNFGYAFLVIHKVYMSLTFSTFLYQPNLEIHISYCCSSNGNQSVQQLTTIKIKIYIEKHFNSYEILNI